MRPKSVTIAGGTNLSDQTIPAPVADGLGALLNGTYEFAGYGEIETETNPVKPPPADRPTRIGFGVDDEDAWDYGDLVIGNHLNPDSGPPTFGPLVLFVDPLAQSIKKCQAGNWDWGSLQSAFFDPHTMANLHAVGVASIGSTVGLFGTSTEYLLLRWILIRCWLGSNVRRDAGGTPSNISEHGNATSRFAGHPFSGSAFVSIDFATANLFHAQQNDGTEGWAYLPFSDIAIRRVYGYHAPEDNCRNLSGDYDMTFTGDPAQQPEFVTSVKLTF